MSDEDIDDDILDFLLEDPEPTQPYPLQEEYDGVGLTYFWGRQTGKNAAERYRDSVLSGVHKVLNDPASLFFGCENPYRDKEANIFEESREAARILLRKFLQDDFASEILFVVRDCAFAFDESDGSWVELLRYRKSDEEIRRCSSVVLVEHDQSADVLRIRIERFANLAMSDLAAFGRSCVVILPTGGAHAVKCLQQSRRPSQAAAELTWARRRQPSALLTHQYRRSSGLPFLAVVAPFSLPEIAALGLLSPRKPKANKLESPADIRAYDMAHLPDTAQERVDEMTIWLFQNLLVMDKGGKNIAQEAKEAAKDFLVSKGVIDDNW